MITIKSITDGAKATAQLKTGVQFELSAGDFLNEEFMDVGTITVSSGELVYTIDDGEPVTVAAAVEPTKEAKK